MRNIIFLLKSFFRFGWFVDKDLAGGGALVDMGVHAIDTVRYLLGDPQPKEVYAKIRN